MAHCRLPILYLFLLPSYLWAQPPQLTLPIGHAEGVKACIFSDDEKYLLSADEGGFIILWETASARPLHYYSGDCSPDHLAIAPNNSLIAVVGGDCGIQIWEVAQRKLLIEILEVPENIKKLQFSADGCLLLAKTEGGPHLI